MGSTTQAILVAGLLILAAGLVAWRTWRTRRKRAVWLVPPDSKLAHAFRQVELRTFDDVTALRHCGRWPVAELHTNVHADHCVPCERALEELGKKAP